ncbi:hypothetical protein [Litorisediminicola beolgyonensis]|uniref:O-Antigen ligase n=1 Tax=Litorisediminicola beolgyonensis TaxID=1173614 RepID=A0ABW3ZJY1_9RHOB
MTPTTPLALLIMVLALWLGPRRGFWLVAVALPFGSAAALSVGGTGTLSLADAALISLWLAWGLRDPRLTGLSAALTPGAPGTALIALLLWAGLGAMILPELLSARTEVYVAVQREGAAVWQRVPLAPGPGALGQCLRLALSVSALLLAQHVLRQGGAARGPPVVLAAATLMHAALAGADLASHTMGMPHLLDPLRSMRAMMLDNQVVGGVKRLVGGFPEPAGFAYFTIGLYAFWLRLWLSDHAPRGAGALTLLCGALLLRSTSSAAWACGAVVTLWILARHGRPGVERGQAVVLACLPGALGLLVIAWLTVPWLQGLTDQLLVQKLASVSGAERQSWALQSLRNLVETGGLGTGLGMSRSSGWLFACLGSLGVIGTGLYLKALAPVLFGSPDPSRPMTDVVILRAAQSGAGAILLQALLTRPHPDLGLFFAVLAGSVLGLRQRSI